MRHQLIEALLYPRKMVEELIAEGNFQHKNLYEATGERCQHCDGSGNCGWATCLHDFRHYDDMTTEELGAALREGIRLVESLFNELHHDETSCHCETCTWVRNAEHLIEEVEHHLPHVDPAIVARTHEEF